MSWHCPIGHAACNCPGARHITLARYTCRRMISDGAIAESWCVAAALTCDQAMAQAIVLSHEYRFETLELGEKVDRSALQHTEIQPCALVEHDPTPEVWESEFPGTGAMRLTGSLTYPIVWPNER